MKKGYFIRALFYFALGAVIVGQPWDREEMYPTEPAKQICQTKDLSLKTTVWNVKAQSFTIVCKPHKD